MTPFSDGQRRPPLRGGPAGGTTGAGSRHVLNEIILGAALLAAVVWLLRPRTGAKVTAFRRPLRRMGGIALLTFGVMLMARGQLPIGLPLAVLGAGLAGWIQLPGIARQAAQRQDDRQARRVSTAFIDLEVHPMTGAMRGTVRAGRLAGRSLISLGSAELAALHQEVASDQRSRSVLEAYLDRRSPGWRKDFQEDSATGRTRRRGHTMAQEEAYQILGVQPGAGADEIRRAHRALMKKVHPDQGGTTALAARVNEAKDVLLGSHPQNS